MNDSVMREFLSEDNMNLHFSHIKTMSHKYSIIKKSTEGLIATSSAEVKRCKVPASLKNEAIILLSYIEAHKIYFDSFAHISKKCNNVRKRFGSEERCLYEVLSLAKENEHRFVYVYLDSKGRATIAAALPQDIHTVLTPILAIDLYEHSYFYDYGFNKDKYLQNAIGRLNIEKLDNALSCS